VRYGDCWIGGLVATLGLTAIFAAWRLPFWSDFGPGPSFFPFLVGLLLVILGCFVAAEGSPRRKRQAAPAANLSRPLQVSAALFGYFAVFEAFGFILATGLFIFTVLRWVEKRGAWQALTVALSVTIAVHILFVTLLSVSLPKGMIPWMP